MYLIARVLLIFINYYTYTLILNGFLSDELIQYNLKESTIFLISIFSAAPFGTYLNTKTSDFFQKNILIEVFKNFSFVVILISFLVTLLLFFLHDILSLKLQNNIIIILLFVFPSLFLNNTILGFYNLIQNRLYYILFSLTNTFFLLINTFIYFHYNHNVETFIIIQGGTYLICFLFYYQYFIKLYPQLKIIKLSAIQNWKYIYEAANFGYVNMIIWGAYWLLFNWFTYFKISHAENLDIKSYIIIYPLISMMLSAINNIKDSVLNPVLFDKNEKEINWDKYFKFTFCISLFTGICLILIKSTIIEIFFHHKNIEIDDFVYKSFTLAILFEITRICLLSINIKFNIEDENLKLVILIAKIISIMIPILFFTLAVLNIII